MPARAVHAADGAGQRRRDPRRRVHRRPDGGRARRARRQGRPRRRGDAPDVPPRRRGAVRRRVQADGHVPRDGATTAAPSCAASSRAPPTCCSPVRRSTWTPTDRRRRWPARSTGSWPRTTGWRARACACWPSPGATSTPPRSTRPATCWRSSTISSCSRSSASSTRRARRRSDAIALCKDAGIRVRMITGDHATTAAAIAGQLGIEGRALTGAEFAAMPDDQLKAEIDGIGVVARVAPEDKVRLVSILKEQGNIVAMTGDGVNDAPALTRADIGVAMGITGTEVTKDAAEMILTDDNFATIVTAVEGGRGLYDNLMKYVRVQMIMLAGFILLFVGAGIFDDRRRHRRCCRCRSCGSTSPSTCCSPSASASTPPTPGLMKRTPAIAGGAGDRAGARRPAGHRRPAHRHRHARRRGVGRGPLRAGGRHDDGADDDLAAPHRRRARVARSVPQRLHREHVRQPPLQPAHARRARPDVPGHDRRRPEHAPRHRRSSTATSGGRASSP